MASDVVEVLNRATKKLGELRELFTLRIVALEDENTSLRSQLAAAEKKLKAYEQERANKAAIALDHITQTGTLKTPRRPVIND